MCKKMTKKRFHIEDNGIWDNWKDDNKKLRWIDLCNTLNHLNSMADEKFTEYEYIVSIEHEKEILEEKLKATQRLLESIKDYMYDIDLILEE